MYLRNLTILLCLFISLPILGREFPLCLYGVNDPADLTLIKKAGFSCIQTYKQDPQALEALAQEAQKLDLKVVFSPTKVWKSPYAQKAQQWPILAWYLIDEPDVHRLDRDQVRYQHQTTKKAFPNQPTTLVIGQGKTKIPYYDIPDIMMVDWYPVPHLPLTSFGDNVRYTKEGMVKANAQDHPLWGVVQIFDWKNFKQYRPDNDRIGRFPTEDEIRFMSYHGILNGATGLFYFLFNHLGKPLPQSAPEYWERVRNVTKELAQFKEVIENGTSTDNPIRVEIPLMMQTWQYKGYLYTVVLNTSDKSFSLPAILKDKSFKALYGRKKEDNLPPYYVLILKHKQ